MSTGNPLYLLANPVRIRDAKIHLLSAQSAVLLSREVVKRIIDLRHSEKVYKTKMSNDMSQLKLSFKRLESMLPMSREKINRHVEKKVSGKKVVRHVVVNPIRNELDIITEKLRELGA